MTASARRKAVHPPSCSPSLLVTCTQAMPGQGDSSFSIIQCAAHAHAQQHSPNPPAHWQVVECMPAASATGKRASATHRKADLKLEQALHDWVLRHQNLPDRLQVIERHPHPHLRQPRGRRQVQAESVHSLLLGVWVMQGACMAAAAGDMAWQRQYTLPPAPVPHQQQSCASVLEQAGEAGSRQAAAGRGGQPASASHAPGRRARALVSRPQCRCGRATSSGGCTRTRGQRRRRTPTRGRTPAGGGQGGGGGDNGRRQGGIEQHSTALCQLPRRLSRCRLLACQVSSPTRPAMPCPALPCPAMPCPASWLSLSLTHHGGQPREEVDDRHHRHEHGCDGQVVVGGSLKVEQGLGGGQASLRARGAVQEQGQGEGLGSGGESSVLSARQGARVAAKLAGRRGRWWAHGRGMLAAGRQAVLAGEYSAAAEAVRCAGPLTRRSGLPCMDVQCAPPAPPSPPNPTQAHAHTHRPLTRRSGLSRMRICRAPMAQRRR